MAGKTAEPVVRESILTTTAAMQHRLGNELICDMVQASGGKAAIVGLDVIAERAKRRQTPPPKAPA